MRSLAVLLVAFILAGCAIGPDIYSGGHMIPGRLVDLSTGALIPLQLELSTGQGRVAGSHPKTGELFSGNYTAIPETKVVQYTRDTWLGPQTTQQAVEMSASVPATAILIGDKGTVINLSIRIKPGNAHVLPIGFGDGADNKGGKYNL